MLGIKAHGNLNADNFNIHWNALPVLFYGFCFIVFHLSSYSLLIFLNPHALILTRSAFVEAGPQHMVPNVGQEVKHKTHKSIARCKREYVEGPHKKNYTVSGEVSNERRKINSR